MHHRSLILFLTVLSFFGSALQNPLQAATVEKDIPFATVDGTPLTLDLHLPATNNAPLVVWIHGGGWRNGSKDDCKVDWLTEHGMAVASISYRLTDTATFPAQIHDCKGAIRWLRAHADQYGYRVDKIAVAGSSAGGHLAALLGTSSGIAELEGSIGGNLDHSSRVDAVIDYYGATDFALRAITQPSRANAKGSVVYDLLGGAAKQKIELAALASAATHVTDDDPPFLVFHGDRDNTVLLDQSQRIQQVYREVGLPLALHVLSGSGHGGKEFFSGSARQQTVDFLKEHLQGITPSRSLPRATPESQGMRSSDILALVDALDQEVRDIHSLMVVRHGKVVSEAWWQPEAAGKPHILWSLSKSFTSTAVGIAIAEGKLNLDDPVLKFFPDDAPKNPSEHLRAMRVRDLLTMSTGHDPIPRLGPDDHWVRKFLATDVPHQPGTHFLYNTPATYMQSAIIQEVTGETVLKYLEPRLFQPLGIEQPTWQESPQGISLGGYGLFLKTEDLAKFGQLLLQKGNWNGRQLIPSDWVALATAKQVDNSDAPSGRNPDWREGYGFQFWQCRHHAFRGDGKDGQFCVVLPKQDAVVIMTAKTNQLQKQLDLVWQHLLPAFLDEPLAESPADWDKLQERCKNLIVN